MRFSIPRFPNRDAIRCPVAFIWSQCFYFTRLLQIAKVFCLGTAYGLALVVFQLLLANLRNASGTGPTVGALEYSWGLYYTPRLVHAREVQKGGTLD
jgi:hypothetical protein